MRSISVLEKKKEETGGDFDVTSFVSTLVSKPPSIALRERVIVVVLGEKNPFIMLSVSIFVPLHTKNKKCEKPCCFSSLPLYIYIALFSYDDFVIQISF